MEVKQVQWLRVPQPPSPPRLKVGSTWLNTLPRCTSSALGTLKRLGFVPSSPEFPSLGPRTSCCASNFQRLRNKQCCALSNCGPSLVDPKQKRIVDHIVLFQEGTSRAVHSLRRWVCQVLWKLSSAWRHAVPLNLCYQFGFALITHANLFPLVCEIYVLPRSRRQAELAASCWNVCNVLYYNVLCHRRSSRRVLHNQQSYMCIYVPT